MNDVNFPINQANQAVGTSLAAVGSPIALNGAGRLVSILLSNTGSYALTHLSIYRQYSPNGAFVPWLADTDFQTATSKCSASGGTSGNAPNTLPAGDLAWIDLDCGLVNAIQIYAQAGTATTLTITGNSRRQV